MIRHTKRLFIFVFGGTLLIIGILFLVLPGPGLPIIILGLIVLATEFVWAERLLHHTKNHYHRQKNNLNNFISRAGEKSNVNNNDSSKEK